MKKIKRITSLIITLVLVVTMTGVIAFADEEQDELRAQNEALQEEINASKARIGELQGSVEEMEAYVAELDAEIDILVKAIEESEQMINAKQEQIDKLEVEIDEFKAKVDQKKVEIDEKQAKIDERYESMKKRIVFLYECAQTSYIDAIFSSDSFSEAFQKIHYLLELTDYDRDIRVVIIQEQEELKAIKAEYEEDLAKLKEQQNKLMEDKAILLELKATQKSAKDETEELFNQKEAELDELYAEISELETIQAGMESAIAANQDRIDEITRAYNLQAADGSGYSYDGAQFSWPLPSPYYANCISSWFGWRYDPDVLATGASTFHSGLDIWAPVGTPIYAPLTGVCVANFWDGGIGYTVAFYHGNGLYTECHHMCQASHIAVGEEVYEGQCIGYVGATGQYCTGPHLHFGVCIGDSSWALCNNYVDPAPYLGV